MPKSNFSPEIENKTKEYEVDENGKIITPIQKYANLVRAEYVPEVDEKKKKQREDIIFSLEDPKNANKKKKYTLIKQKKKRVLLKKANKSLTSKFKWKLKLDESEINKVEAINQNLIHKPKKVNLQPIYTFKKTEPLDKKPDYLQEMISKREEKNKRIKSSKSKGDSDEEIFESNKKSKKWEKAVNNKNGTLIENINDVQLKANLLEKEANMKEKILQVKGGFENNIELGQKVSNMLIDSIHAKINILKKMNEI